MKVALVFLASLMTSCVLSAPQIPGKIAERAKESFEESIEETLQELKSEAQGKVEEKIESVKENVEETIHMRLEQILTQIVSQIKANVQADLPELQQKIYTVQQKIIALQQQISAKEANYEQQIEVKVQEIEQKILQIQSNIAEYQQQINNVRQQIPVIQQEISEIKDDISGELEQIKQHIPPRLQEILATIEQILQEIKMEIEQIVQEISAISHRVISSRMEEIQLKISRVKERISAIVQKFGQIIVKIPQLVEYFVEVKLDIAEKVKVIQLKTSLKAILLKAELELEEMEMKADAVQKIRNVSISLTPEQLLLLKSLSENPAHQGQVDLGQMLLDKILLEDISLTPEQLLLLKNIKTNPDHGHIMSLEQKILEEKLAQHIELSHEELLKLAELRAHRSGTSTLEELFLLHHVNLNLTPKQLILLKSFTPNQILNYYFLQNIEDFSLGGFIDSLVQHLSELAHTAAMVENNEILLYNLIKSRQPLRNHFNLAEVALTYRYQETMAQSLRRTKFMLMLGLTDLMHSESDITPQQKAAVEMLLHRIRADENQEWKSEEFVLLKRYAQGKASFAVTVAAYKQLEAMNSGPGAEIRSMVMNMVRIELVKGSGIGMNQHGEWMSQWLSNADWQNATECEKMQELWMLFKLRHHKSYKTRLEESMRRRNFEMKVSEIVMHNIEYQLGKQLFTMGLNHLSDWTDDEVSMLKGYIPSAQVTAAKTAQEQDVVEGETARAQIPAMPLYTNTVPVSSLPAYVNWTNTSWVGPIQDQYQCGSCWAFSSAGALEAQYYNKTKTFVTMSEQNLVDCTYYLGNLGCSGGNVELAFDYVMTTGIDTYASYPYTGRANNGTCKYNPANSVTTDSGWMLIPQGNELALQQAVAQVGPVSAAIDASLSSFDAYVDGVYAPANCSTTALDHAILVVGYGTTSDGQDYWLIKNSWGVDWGMEGYMMMARNVNMCGIATAALFPLIN